MELGNGVLELDLVPGSPWHLLQEMGGVYFVKAWGRGPPTDHKVNDAKLFKTEVSFTAKCIKCTLQNGLRKNLNKDPQISFGKMLRNE